METIGERIKRLRERKGLTQRELAEMTDITEASLSRYENNLRTPRAQIISKLAVALDTTSDYILTAYIPGDMNGAKFTRRDVSEYDAFIQTASTFFMDDEVAERDKEALFRDISELFWRAKEKSYKEKGDKEE